MPDALMLFAAGFGTRMGALTRTMPKPLLPVAGRPLIDRALDLAAAAGIGRIVVNAHYRAAQIEAHLEHRDVAVSHEAAGILDTGGGLRAALPLLGRAPCFTLNPDAVWRGANPLSALADAWRPDEMGALLMLLPAESALGRDGRGDFSADANGRLTRGGQFLYTGAQILDPVWLDGIEDDVFSLNVVWDRIAAEGRLYGIVYRGAWCDVGSPAGLDAAAALLEESHVRAE
ncbi:nucleotidyltransferase family protein [Rhodobacteraceae bacterium CCMM004]|nr:nucleotidyltransferase family protein [Rhodobacteraceae bacterium CCMM004]